jgi:hypothetical protein
MSEHRIGGDNRTRQREQPQEFKGRFVLVRLAVDSQLRQDDLSLVRIAGNEMDGGQLFAGRAAQAFPIDCDRSPIVTVSLRLEPSADRRFKSLDVDRPQNHRERTLGQGLGPSETQARNDLGRKVPPEIDHALEPAHAGHHCQNQQRQDGRKRVSLAFGPTRIWDLLE